MTHYPCHLTHWFWICIAYWAITTLPYGQQCQSVIKLSTPSLWDTCLHIWEFHRKTIESLVVPRFLFNCFSSKHSRFPDSQHNVGMAITVVCGLWVLSYWMCALALEYVTIETRFSPRQHQMPSRFDLIKCVSLLWSFAHQINLFISDTFQWL